MISETKDRGHCEDDEENLLVSGGPLHVPGWRGDAPSRATYEPEDQTKTYGYRSVRNGGEQVNSSRSEQQGTNSVSSGEGRGSGGGGGGGGGRRGHESEDSVCDAPAENGLGAPTSKTIPQLSRRPQIRVAVLASLNPILTNSQQQLAPR